MRSEVELGLPREPIAPALARAAVADMGLGLPEAAMADVELLTSEVVSNAVRHADLKPSEEIILRVVTDGHVRVEVMDPGPPFEAGPPKAASGSGGWGLFLVDAVATAWGVEPEGGGKKVWFEVGTR
jgi:anti-sigma regulatory factor (Ser/Thr protein kinase)